jgi:TonB family protein
MKTRTPRPRSAVLISLCMHGAVLLLFLAGAAARMKVHPVQPAKAGFLAMLQVAGGSHRISIPSFEAPNTSKAEKPEHVKDPQPKLMDPARAAHKEKVAPSSMPLDSAGKGTGTALAGNGSDAQDATPAFPVFSPKPPVGDRALLPAAEQHIVVDVNVSETGDVTGETLVKGMGNALDQIVLDTVKTWRFHPATVNGNPVASEAELIFPFNPSYPVKRG